MSTEGKVVVVAAVSLLALIIWTALHRMTGLGSYGIRPLLDKLEDPSDDLDDDSEPWS